MVKIKRALISVQDKSNIAELAQFLSKKGVEIIATPGTQKVIEKAGAECIDIATLTGGGVDWLGGRLKTTHPLIYASIITDRENEQEMEQLKSIGGRKIDLVIADIPPSGEKAVNMKAKDVKGDESKDIGRVYLLRTVMKSRGAALAFANLEGFKDFITELDECDLKVKKDLRKKMVLDVAEKLTDFDIEIYKELSDGLSSEGDFLSDTVFMKLKKVMDLRYGENPHQRAAYFVEPGVPGLNMNKMNQVKGPPLSMNNLADLDAAINISLEFEKDSVVIVKHGNPTGVALDKDPTKAYMKAREADRVSAFGATVVFNFQVEKKTARELTNTFIEVLAAPRFTDGALAYLKAEKKAAHMRIIEIEDTSFAKTPGGKSYRTSLGGIVVQENDDMLVPDNGQIQIVTKRKPTRKELADLVMAWKVCKHVRSNAIVLVKGGKTLGIGAGQMSRMDSLKIAMDKAGEEAMGAALASDAFLPFQNVIEEAAKHGIVTVIEPGGSRRDDEIVAACDEHNIGLCLTGMRHFKH